MSSPAGSSAQGFTEFPLSAGEYTASITARGAAVRQLRFRGVDVIVPFDDPASNPDFRGVIAAPWPNRMRDGTYTFDGERHQVDVTEPERRCALHGFAHQVDWTLESLTDSAVVLSLELGPLPGYPFALRITAHHIVSDRGLDTHVSATNAGNRTAPYGVCPHPYLVAGPGELDSWTLHLPADTFLEVTPDRLLPLGTRSVADHEFDFRTARPIGDTVMDHAFTDTARDRSGQARMTITDPSGTGAGMEWDASLPWVQIHTADRIAPIPIPIPSRRGLAVEPMTCPPDAFTTGTDLIRLAPGAHHTAAWRIFAI